MEGLKRLPRLYLITDGSAASRGDFLRKINAALKGGVRMIQLREKALSAKELLELAKAVHELTAIYGARLIINDRADITLLSGAEGVHLTSKSYSASSARELLGKDSIIGVSTHSLDMAEAAEMDGADFVTFGPVFHTPSKAGYGEPLGLTELKRAVRALSIPVYGLGGINSGNVGQVLKAGAEAAVIGAIMGSLDIEAGAKELLREFGPDTE